MTVECLALNRISIFIYITSSEAQLRWKKRWQKECKRKRIEWSVVEFSGHNMFIIFFLKNISISLYVYGCLHVCMYVYTYVHMYVYHMSVPLGQKELNPLELELQIIGSHHVSAGNSSARVVSALNHGANSPAAVVVCTRLGCGV